MLHFRNPCVSHPPIQLLEVANLLWGTDLGENMQAVGRIDEIRLEMLLKSTTMKQFLSATIFSCIRRHRRTRHYEHTCLSAFAAILPPSESFSDQGLRRNSEESHEKPLLAIA